MHRRARRRPPAIAGWSLATRALLLLVQAAAQQASAPAPRCSQRPCAIRCGGMGHGSLAAATAAVRRCRLPCAGGRLVFGAQASRQRPARSQALARTSLPPPAPLRLQRPSTSCCHCCARASCSARTSGSRITVRVCDGRWYTGTGETTPYNACAHTRFGNGCSADRAALICAHCECAHVPRSPSAGDSPRKHVLDRMAPDDLADLRTAEAQPRVQAAQRAAVVVCHSMPSNYAVPDPAYHAGEQCPPDPKSAQTVARPLLASACVRRPHPHTPWRRKQC